MNFILPKIYPITDTRISGLSHLAQVERLVTGGAKFIQLRDKDASPRDFFEAAEKVIDFARKHCVKIVINDRVDIALALKAEGVHLGQDDLPPEHARKILGPDALIGFSTHSLKQAVAAVKLPVDYIALGPIFATATKENPDAVLGLAGLREVRSSLNNRTLVAIGGINKGNLNSIFDGGADSVAVIGSILSDATQISEEFAQHDQLAQ